MRYVVIPTHWLCQIADAYCQLDDAVDAALRGGGDNTLLEVMGEATNDGHNVYKALPHNKPTETEKANDHSGN